MASFKDRHGTEWDVNIVHGDLAALKSKFGIIPVMNDEFRNAVAEIVSDRLRLAALMLWLCREQMKERGIDDEAMARRFVPETFDDVTEAVLEAFADFFPTSKGQRKALRTHLKTEFERINREAEEQTMNQLSTLKTKAGESAALSA